MTSETKIVYNGACPVCAFEINAYQRYAQNHDLPLAFEDLNASDLGQYGLTRDQAARRLYVKHHGELLSGLPAFLALWSEMPRYRWLARVFGLPVIRPLAAFLYDRMMAPALYAWNRRRHAKQG
ncbi:MAG: DUF393 domain-containing protein [Pseudomonadota bacterium]